MCSRYACGKASVRGIHGPVFEGFELERIDTATR
jgi:hypothetical protein